MTRRSPGIVIATFCCLLGVTTSAHAECAWALWVNPAFKSTGWHLTRGVPAWYASKADCESTATYREGGTTAQPGDVMCLPQGVQPQGTPANYEYGPWRGSSSSWLWPGGR